MPQFTELIEDLVHLIYPSMCLVCENELANSEKHVCSICKDSLTHTSYHLYQDSSPMDKLFWGRADITKTYAHFYFKKHSAIQTLLFNLKYKNNPSIGKHFGKEIGKKIQGIVAFENVDLLLPIPLHFKKHFIRGYNQSEAITKGISEVLSVPMKNGIAKRIQHTSTQTSKSRFERWDNVQSIFKINSAITKYRHAIIIDDVITTGSTIESFIHSIRAKAPNLQLSIVTLAIT